MPDRIANIYVLCEDQEQQMLVRRYLKRVGASNARFGPVAGKSGCGSQFVREQFPKQVAICRGTLGKKTKCLLIVVTDADDLSVDDREQTLHDRLSESRVTKILAVEPIVILVPKWQVETWIKCLLGQQMDEQDKKSDQPPVNADQVKTAALVLFDWSRTGAQPGPTCVPSLMGALPNWLRIG